MNNDIKATIICFLFVSVIIIGSYKFVKSLPPITTIPECSTLILELEYSHRKSEDQYKFELTLANMRNDIYKRQIRNMLAENDGLRTIINDDEKIRHLITTK